MFAGQVVRAPARDQLAQVASCHWRDPSSASAAGAGAFGLGFTP